MDRDTLSKQLKKVPAPRFKHYKVKALAKYDILHKNQAKDYQKAQINPVDPLSMRKSLRPQLYDNFDTIDDVEGVSERWLTFHACHAVGGVCGEWAIAAT